jgi:hypothetical protein
MPKQFVARMTVRNDAKRPRVIWMEPWAEDFTLLPGEEFEIVAHDRAKQPWFALVEWQDATQVYVESLSGWDVQDGAKMYEQTVACFEVLQDGNRLEGGHNRKAALDAGLTL